jgi:hypothetical protein
MSDPLYKKTLPAVGLAVGVGVLAHHANANAAHALGIPVAAVALLVGLAILVVGALV